MDFFILLQAVLS